MVAMTWKDPTTESSIFGLSLLLALALTVLVERPIERLRELIARKRSERLRPDIDRAAMPSVTKRP
jgi:hypothetical protein